jgi:elongation factor G
VAQTQGMTGPLLSIALTPHTRADVERLAAALRALTSEDPTLLVRSDAATSATIISATGEEQLEIVVDRLAREFGVAGSLGPPQVEYRERLTRSAEGEMKDAGAVDGIRYYAHVKLRVMPREPGAGNVVINEIVGGIPAAFIPSTIAGITESLEMGALAGHPLIDVSVTLFDGSYHDVDSSERAFRQAASLALRDAVARAKAVRVEPVMRIEVTAPDRDREDVVRGLLRRRAQMQLLAQQGKTIKVYAVAPLANLLGYVHELRAQTGDQGSVTMTFHCYEPVRPHDDNEDRRDGPGVRQPLRPRPSPRAGHIAVPLDDT